MIFQGGIGGVIAKPTGGNLATPSWPQRFFTIQSAELDFAQKIVEAMGQNKGPDDVFPSDLKYTGKCGFLQISPDIYNTLMFGDSVVSGSQYIVSQESHTLTGTPVGAITTATVTSGGTGYAVGDTGIITGNGGSGATYTVATETAGVVATVTIGSGANAGRGYTTGAGASTQLGGSQPGVGTGLTIDITAVSAGVAPGAVTVTNSATYAGDEGVQYSVNPSGYSGAANLTLTATDPPTVQGTYFNSGGPQYLFSAYDSLLTVLISYAVTSTAGRILTNYNHVQGYGPYFELWLPLSYQGNNTLHIRRARVSSMGFKLKRDGYLESPFDFTCYPDGSGAFFDFSVANLG